MNCMKNIEIILPVYNEEKILKKNVLKVKQFFDKYCKNFLIVIVDNGSTDHTYEIAESLQNEYSNIAAFRLKEKGRGRALRFRILNSPFPFIGYMDIDLSSNLSCLLRMYEELSRGYDIVIGSRLLPGAEVQRSLIRRFLSTGYSFLVQCILNLPYKDYQCGFKLFRRERILDLLTLIKNNNWFFDTELIYYAHNNKLRIKEIPVLWKERKRGKVRLIPTIVEDVLGIVRLKLNDG